MWNERHLAASLACGGILGFRGRECNNLQELRRERDGTPIEEHHVTIGRVLVELRTPTCVRVRNKARIVFNAFTNFSNLITIKLISSRKTARGGRAAIVEKPNLVLGVVIFRPAGTSVRST